MYGTKEQCQRPALREIAHSKTSEFEAATATGFTPQRACWLSDRFEVFNPERRDRSSSTDNHTARPVVPRRALLSGRPWRSPRIGPPIRPLPALRYPGVSPPRGLLCANDDTGTAASTAPSSSASDGVSCDVILRPPIQTTRHSRIELRQLTRCAASEIAKCRPSDCCGSVRAHQCRDQGPNTDNHSAGASRSQECCLFPYQMRKGFPNRRQSWSPNCLVARESRCRRCQQQMMTTRGQRPAPPQAAAPAKGAS